MVGTTSTSTILHMNQLQIGQKSCGYLVATLTLPGSYLASTVFVFGLEILPGLSAKARVWGGELNHDPARIRSRRIEPLGRCSGLGFDSSSLKHSSSHPCEYEICNWEFTIDIDGIAISVKFVGRMTWGIEFTVKKGILMGGCVTEKILYFQAKPHRCNTF